MSVFREGVQSVNSLFDACCARYNKMPSLGMAMEKSWSYEELRRRVLALASRLREMGIEKGDRLMILAENSPGWGLVWLSIVRLGAIAVPVLPEMPEGDIHHILDEVKVKAIFTTRRQVDKLRTFAEGLRGPVFTLDDFREKLDGMVFTPFSEYLNQALSRFGETPDEFAEVDADDVASIIYTSGTSGHSRAVMLTHRNFTANAFSAMQLAEIPPGATWLSILPMSHAYEFTCGFILPLVFGARVVYAGKLPTPAVLKKLCDHEQPTVIFAVPLILEKIYKKRVQPQLEKGIFRVACSLGFLRRLIARRIGAKLLDFFGGRLLFMGVGGAKLNPEVERFFCDAKFPYLVGYGMTEASPLIAGGPLFDPAIRVGSTGRPIPDVEVRIDNPDPASGIGEIVVRGDNVMKGYYNNPETTAGTLRDGWLCTGDAGRFDEAGNLHVTGRLKNVIVMANGENVYPEPVEYKIAASPLVADVLAMENNGQLEAWALPDYEGIEAEHPDLTLEQRNAFIARGFEQLREEVNRQLSKTARLVRIYEKREPFIKTATMKIKRCLYDARSIRKEEEE